MNKRHSLDIRKMVLEMYRDGYPVEKILQKSKVSRSRMYALVREAGLPHRKQKRHEQHTSANEADISSISLKEKKKIIDQFQISKIKSAFATEHHIPRSTLYNWSNNDNLIQDQNGNTVDMKMYRHDYQSVREFKERIANYIKYYNENRPHESLGYVTPAAFEQRFLLPNCPDTTSNPDNQ